MVAVADGMGGDYLAGFAHGFVDEAAFCCGTFHAVGVVDVDADYRGAAADGAVAVGDDGSCKGKHKEGHGEDAEDEEQPAAQFAAATALGMQLGEAVDIAEIDGAVAVEVEEMYGDRYEYRQ